MALRKLTWYEFFAGGGMARIGLSERWKCTFANEWCEKKAAAYKAYFNPCQELKIRDVRSLSPHDLPGTPDLVWASFPCQDLSLAGSGAGLAGERSGTFAPFWTLIEGLVAEQRKPRIVVLENVVGTITSHGGRDFAEIFRKVSEAGYRVGPMVIDAARFVPQSRPRLFIIGATDSANIPKRLGSPEPMKAWHLSPLVETYFALPTPLRKAWVSWRLPEPNKAVPSLSSLIENEPVGVGWHSQEETTRLISLMSDLNLKKLNEAQRTGAQKIGTIYRRMRPAGDGATSRTIQRAEARFDEVSGCLRTPVGGSSRQIILVVEGKRVRSRLLSPREAARLMGVPEDYPIPHNYNDAYHLFGDGLVVPVVSWLERHLLAPLSRCGVLEQVA
ncbi:MAG TPA: DNA cytosine methyltransferase [Terriglobia bacterium]|nr:DNA cytosine methyltransferase [Terriglobia bacterium]